MPAHRTTPFSTHQLLASLVDGGPADERITLQSLAERFQERAYGVLLFAATLPAFIPLPLGVGAIAGPLVMLVGVQMLLTVRRPWLPGFLRRRGPSREAFGRFMLRAGPWLRRLERVVRPRWQALTLHRGALAFSGLLLVALGFLLALPIPLTNYPFGLLLMLFCVALIERDGLLMAIAWAIGGATVASFLLLSEAAAGWVSRVY